MVSTSKLSMFRKLPIFSCILLNLFYASFESSGKDRNLCFSKDFDCINIYIVRGSAQYPWGRSYEYQDFDCGNIYILNKFFFI